MAATHGSVTITTPIDGATLFGTVPWNVEESTGTAFSCHFFIDGKTYIVDYSKPFTAGVGIPSASLKNGSHKLMAICYTSSGTELGRPEITVTCSNPDTQGPTVTILSPLNGATISGNVTYKARVTDVNTVAKAEFYVDNVLVGVDTTASYDSGTNSYSQYSIAWNSATVTDGSHVLMVKDYDQYGNAGTRSITITTANGSTPPPPPPDTQPPTVTFNQPTVPETGPLPRSMSVSGTAADNIGVTSVQVTMDGSNVATTGTGTWSATVTATSPGSHTISVTAKDAAGNTSTPKTKTWMLTEEKRYASTIS